MMNRRRTSDLSPATATEDHGRYDYEKEFHIRGRQDNPVYVISQPQNCNMSPLGLLGFGITTALLQGFHAAIAEGQIVGIVYALAFAYGGLAQLLAGMWEARRGKLFGAIVFSSYGAFWLTYALYGVFVTSGVYASLGTRAPLQGLEMFLSLWGILTFGFFIISLALNIALQLLLFFLTCTFFLLAGGVKHTTCDRVAGWFGLVTAAIAVYLGFAEMANECWKKPIFPLGTVNWLKFLGVGREPYDVGRTEPKNFPVQYNSQAGPVQAQHATPHHANNGGNAAAPNLAGNSVGTQDAATMV